MDIEDRWGVVSCMMVFYVEMDNNSNVHTKIVRRSFLLEIGIIHEADRVSIIMQPEEEIILVSAFLH
jgi:hypothetical protein